MLYSEFVQGTGCKENDHNYKVYKDLEIMYMNSDMSKTEIYEYGKKLVDNSRSEEEIALENQVKEEIASHKAEIERYKRYIEEDTDAMNWWKEEDDKEMVKTKRNSIKFWKEQIKYHRCQINALKWVLS